MKSLLIGILLLSSLNTFAGHDLNDWHKGAPGKGIASCVQAAVKSYFDARPELKLTYMNTKYFGEGDSDTLEFYVATVSVKNKSVIKASGVVLVDYDSKTRMCKIAAMNTESHFENGMTSTNVDSVRVCNYQHAINIRNDRDGKAMFVPHAFSSRYFESISRSCPDHAYGPVDQTNLDDQI